MPARDPAASSHLPIVLSTSPHDRPSLLPSHSSYTHSHSSHMHEHHGGMGRGRSSSSAFSRFHEQPHPSAHYPGTFVSTHAPGPSAGTNAGRRVSTPDGLVSKLFRRLSLDTTATDHGDDHHHHHLPGHVSEDGGEPFEDDDSEVFGSSHTSRAIRDSTNRLASMSFTGRSLLTGGIPPMLSTGGRSASSPSAVVDLSASEQPPASPHAGPSGLSKLMERGRRQAGASPESPGAISEGSGEATPLGVPRSLEADKSDMPTPPAMQRAVSGGRSASVDGGGGGGTGIVSGVLPVPPLSTSPTASVHSSHSHAQEAARRRSHSSHIHDRTSALAGVEEVDEEMGDSSELRRYLARGEPPSERTPLLGSDAKTASWASRTLVDVQAARNSLSKYTAKDMVKMCVEEPVKALPAVVLGLLLNVLDGVSYGMILFPVSPYYPDYGSLGVSMFFVSCIIAQLTYSLGGSIFKGGNGSMMIEAVPFYHIICALIQSELEGNAAAIVATTMVSFAFSAILTGIVFFALGYFKLGSLVGYFPRHILVGCIGGVGVFLFVTGLQVSLGLSEDNFDYNLATLKLFFHDFHSMVLWMLPLSLAIFLRVITHFFHHQLIFPAYFLIIPAIFYIVVAIGGWDFQTLRDAGWVFDVGQNVKPWWTFYTEFNFRHVDWAVFWSAMPSQLALVFFGILHVPLNVPALGVSLAEDNVSLNRELVSHGVSNLAAGMFGTVPNYLCYVNTVLFYRVGGDTRLAGLMLAGATAIIMYLGPVVIGYLPITVVAALIFVLGIDLAVESLWDTRNRVNRMEYITICVIAIGMTVFDFVIGLLLGIILACVFFVVQSSRRRPIRTVFNGSTAKSTVRRPRAQRAFIQRVGSQTYVMKLQGFLFFGTIGVVEDEIRRLLDMAEWEHNPIRFLIIDFALVAGLDFSSAEAFVRIQRLLAAKDVLLILCGADPHSVVGTALRAVDLWADQEGTRVEVFGSLNDALEWTENAYLTAFYENQMTKVKDDEACRPRSIDLPKVQRMPFTLAESFQNSPRRTLLARAGDDTLPSAYSAPAAPSDSAIEAAHATGTTPTPRPHAQPLSILMQTIGSYTDMPDSFFAQFTPYFTRVVAHAGDTLWRQGDVAQGLYLIESGSLRATYEYNVDDRVQETMVAGTVAGDLSTLSDTHRNATVVAERDSVLWKLSPESLGRMEKEKPEGAAAFVKVVLKAAVEEVDVVTSHLIAVLS